MGLPEALHAKAMRIFEDYLNQLPEETVRDIISGDQVLSLLRVDRRLALHRDRGIDDAYAFLSGMRLGSDVKGMLASSAPSGSAKSAWIDYVLMTLFGRIVTPPPAPTQARQATNPRGSKGAKPPKPVWSAPEIAKALADIKSVPDGKEYLEQRGPTKPELQELAGLLDVQFNKKTTKPELIESVLWMAIGAPGAFQRARTG